MAKKALDTMDFKGLAKAYQESQTSWNARNWKNFVEEIKARQKKEIMAGLMERCKDNSHCWYWSGGHEQCRHCGIPRHDI